MKANSQSNRLHLFHPEASGLGKGEKKRKEEGTFRQTPASSQFHCFLLAEICSSLSQRIRRKRTSMVVLTNCLVWNGRC